MVCSSLKTWTPIISSRVRKNYERYMFVEEEVREVQVYVPVGDTRDIHI